MNSKVINVVFAGLGGQGVLKASDILADAAFRAGLDIKKSEIHGMSQRGGSVTSDVRFGSQVLSPMVTAGEADFLVVLEPTQAEPNKHMLSAAGTMILPCVIDESKLANRKCLNVAILGVLSKHLQLPLEHWRSAITAAFAPKYQQANLDAFELGRSVA